MPNSTTNRSGFHWRQAESGKTWTSSGVLPMFFLEISQMPRGVESFAIGKQTWLGCDAWCRMFVRGRASRRPVCEPLSPPTRAR